MTFDFETMLDRAGRDALSIDSLGTGKGYAPGAPLPGIDPIPMWIADMNYPTAPCVVRSIVARAEHPAFGYFDAPRAYYDAIKFWYKKRHGVTGIEDEHIGYHNGVLGGVASALYAFTEPGEPILVHSPTYIGFKNTLRTCKRVPEYSPLVRDGDGVWRMDYEDMAQRIERNNIRVAIFCSPHNPTGRTWERWELEKAADVYAEHGVTVIADEIWADFTLRGTEFIPFHTVGDDARARTITMSSVSKTFNLAGLQGSYSLVFDEGLREKFLEQAESSCYNEQNVLSMHALIGAYTDEGSEWVDQMRQTVQGNLDLLCDFVDRTEGLEAYRPEATYVVFIDCTEWCQAHGKSLDELEHELWDAGVAIQDGRMFNGPCHLRANVALPQAKVEEALQRMARVF